MVEHHGCDGRAYFRWKRITRMGYLYSEACFYLWHPGKGGILAETRMLERKPRYGRHHAGFHFTAGNQIAQAGFHKDAMVGSFCIGKKGAKSQNFHVAETEPASFS